MVQYLKKMSREETTGTIRGEVCEYDGRVLSRYALKRQVYNDYPPDPSDDTDEHVAFERFVFRSAESLLELWRPRYAGTATIYEQVALVGIHRRHNTGECLDSAVVELDPTLKQCAQQYDNPETRLWLGLQVVNKALGDHLHGGLYTTACAIELFKSTTPEQIDAIQQRASLVI